jgi:hypothetical protein
VPPSAYGEPVWQGAYVFNISVDTGLNLAGGISHIEDTAEREQYYYSPFFVIRYLYIEDVLYTISNADMKMNSLGNLDYINAVGLLCPSSVTP